MKQITKESDKYLKKNPKLTNFYSLNDYNKENSINNLKSAKLDIDSLKIDYDDELIYDPYFANILNENREVMIENNLIRIIKEGVIISKNRKEVANVSKLIEKDRSKYLKKEVVIINENTVFYPEIFLNENKKMSHSKGRNTCTSGGGGFFGHNHECFEVYGSGGFRSKGRVWSQSFAVYASVGIKTKNQWKRFGIWFDKDASFLSYKMNKFNVMFELVGGSTYIEDWSQESSINYKEDYNTHSVSLVTDIQTAQFTTKVPFVKKFAKARKFESYNTDHDTIKNQTWARTKLIYN